MKKFNLLYLALFFGIFLNARVAQYGDLKHRSTAQFTYEQQIQTTATIETRERYAELMDVIDNTTTNNTEDPKLSNAPTSPTSSNELLIQELNSAQVAQSYPCLSDDALRVYYTQDKDMYFASRSSINSKFSTGKNIFPKFKESVISGWLSSDELTMYIATQSSKLYIAVRNSLDENFTSYKEVKLINAPEGSLFDASFTPDMEELLMYNNDKKERIVKFIKSGENEYTFSNEVDVLFNEIPTGGQLSRDGLRFYVPFKRIVNKDSDYRVIYILSRTNIHGNFEKVEKLKSTKEINITAYQPSVNADETQMIFVTGSGNLWDNNELGQVELIKEKEVIAVKQVVEPIVIDPIKIEVTAYEIEYIGDKNSGIIPVISFSAERNVMIYDYTINTQKPDQILLENPETPVVKNDPVENDRLKNTVKIEMRIAPNPFSDQTQIEVIAPEGGYMVIQVYSMEGQLVEVLFDGQAAKGVNIIKWVKGGLTNGVYTVKTMVGNNITTKKVITCGGTD